MGERVPEEAEPKIPGEGRNKFGHNPGVYEVGGVGEYRKEQTQYRHEPQELGV